jgi:hypothetical protein
MPVSMSYEYDGVTGIGPGETVQLGWCLFRGEFPDPLIDHTQIIRGGPGRHFVEVRRTVEEGETPGNCRAFFYTVKNLSSEFIYTGNNYIFFKVQ